MTLWVDRRGLFEVAAPSSVPELGGMEVPSAGSSGMQADFRTLMSPAKEEWKEADSGSPKGDKQWFTLCRVS